MLSLYNLASPSLKYIPVISLLVRLVFIPLYALLCLSLYTNLERLKVYVYCFRLTVKVYTSPVQLYDALDLKRQHVLARLAMPLIRNYVRAHKLF